MTTPDGQRYLNSGNDPINRQLALTPANAKALGLDVPARPNVYDGEIYFDHRMMTELRLDWDPRDGVRGVDFVGIVMHEVAHVLGFTSGVTLIDASTLPAGPTAPDEVTDHAVMTALDLFRFSAESAPWPDLTPGHEAYFSLDGGVTRIQPFATGEFNGDGFGAAHWLVSDSLMAPTHPAFYRIPVTHVDLLALDVIGWDLIAVPEPPMSAMTTSWLLTLIVWRRQAKTVAVRVARGLSRRERRARRLSRDKSRATSNGSAFACFITFSIAAPLATISTRLGPRGFP